LSHNNALKLYAHAQFPHVSSLLFSVIIDTSTAHSFPPSRSRISHLTHQPASQSTPSQLSHSILSPCHLFLLIIHSSTARPSPPRALVPHLSHQPIGPVDVVTQLNLYTHAPAPHVSSHLFSLILHTSTLRPSHQQSAVRYFSTLSLRSSPHHLSQLPQTHTQTNIHTLSGFSCPRRSLPTYCLPVP
jgi:hypothetical protein